MDMKGVVLTETGRSEALRILRAHRLWEAYLQHVGTPATEIHTRAHTLEHMHDRSAVDYLDDLLGHPVQDPHGKEIPEDMDCMEQGGVVPFSLLRQGRHARIHEVPEAIASIGLKPGDRIRLGDRRDQGRTWVAVQEDGKEIPLDHAAADAILVACE
jgi:manganese/iron transport system permease protein/iron/zinc/copper transport system permease protein